MQCQSAEIIIFMTTVLVLMAKPVIIGSALDSDSEHLLAQLYMDKAQLLPQGTNRRIGLLIQLLVPSGL